MATGVDLVAMLNILPQLAWTEPLNCTVCNHMETNGTSPYPERRDWCDWIIVCCFVMGWYMIITFQLIVCWPSGQQSVDKEKYHLSLCDYRPYSLRILSMLVEALYWAWRPNLTTLGIAVWSLNTFNFCHCLHRSTEKHNTYKLSYMYSKSPDDGLQICPKRVEIYCWNELRINSASSWFSLQTDISRCTVNKT
jgi:hypothetical protein